LCTFLTYDCCSNDDRHDEIIKERSVETNGEAFAFGSSILNRRSDDEEIRLERTYCICNHVSFAQTMVGTEYYVVRDPATKKCTIVDKKPTTTTTIVDNGIFKTRTEAESGMKTMKVCTTD
jgi:hypothetical protein